MASVSFLNVDKIYPGGTKAVSGFSLDIADKEFMVIMGPSGCGKSTLLKLIAGLEKPTSGCIFIGGKDVTDLPPGKRGVAIVMQTNALFPHMSVFDNLAFGLTVLKTDKDTIRKNVLSSAETLGISDLLDRKPSSLSGGQKQRVALGRALAVRPRVFLLDEPLSNLDTSLKSSMRAEIKRLHQAIGTTFVYVTHDQTEAMSLGGRIAVLKDGILSQTGTPRQIYDSPANKFTAQFIGMPAMNFFDAQITQENNSDVLTVSFCQRKMNIKPNCFVNSTATTGYELIMGIRPDNIRLADESDINVSIKNDNESGGYFFTSARVIMIEPAGGENIIHADLNKTGNQDKTNSLNSDGLPGGSIILKCQADRNKFPGDIINIAIDKSKLNFFDKKSGIRIN